MGKQKGQNLVEYALMLAIVVGVGFTVYSSSGGLAGSIRSVFNQTDSLMTAVSLPAASDPASIIARLYDGRFKSLSKALAQTPKDRHMIEISSDSEAGKALARELNIQTKEGDAWFVNVLDGGAYVITYYSADANGGMTYDALKADYAANPSKYYQPNIENYKLRYGKKVTISEGYYDGTGNGKMYPKTTGHVGTEHTNDGSISIYPGSYGWKDGQVVK